jgi:hypothetical protein
LNRRVLMNIRILVLAIALGGFSCNTTEPPSPSPPEPGRTISLEAVYVGVTEAWLRLSIPDSISERNFTLIRNSEAVFTASLMTSDTVVLDEGLVPNQTYMYRAYRLENTSVVDTSDVLSLTTIDTTSHEIDWIVDFLGDGSGSILHDVAIIDDTSAYAVGEIHEMDSLGNWDPHPYNLIKWNGESWTLMRIQFYTICGQANRTPYPASSVLAFGPNDIWIAMDGDQVARWNGVTQTATMCLPVSFSIKKLWGRSSESVYAVGYGGNIFHYDGSIWQRLESGTTLTIWDIWGATDPGTGEEVVLCIASELNFGRKLLQINGTTVTALPDSGLAMSLGALWFDPGRYYYVVGAGIHWKRGLLSPAWNLYKPGVIASYYSHGIRGLGINDVFVVGSFMEVVHFNGSTWKNYDSEIPFASGATGGVSVSEHLVISVGLMGQQAIAIIGRR